MNDFPWFAMILYAVFFTFIGYKIGQRNTKKQWTVVIEGALKDGESLTLTNKVFERHGPDPISNLEASQDKGG